MTNNDELAMQACADFESWWEVHYHNGNPPRFGWAAYREDGGYKIDDDESELDAMWNAWQAAQDCMLAERDADKKRIDEQQEHINSLNEGVNMLLAQYDQLAAAIGWTTEKALSGEGNQEQYAEAMVKRIAELEARTVSVKLPKAFTKSMYGTALYEHEDIVAMLAAAGIKLEVGE